MHTIYEHSFSYDSKVNKVNFLFKIAIFRTQDHGQGHMVIDLDVTGKGFISRVCIPNMKYLSLLVQKLWPMLKISPKSYLESQIVLFGQKLGLCKYENIAAHILNKVTKWTCYNCKRGNFRAGVIFSFFALLSSMRKLPPHKNKTHMPLWRKWE